MKLLRKTIITSLVCTMLFSLVGCKSKSTSALDPDNPVNVTVWNYYNGDQLVAFEKLVEEFNEDIGNQKGIIVTSVSQGDVNTLADSLLDSIEGKAGAQECPAIAAVYSETAYILDKEDALVAFDSYFSEDELSAYVPAFIEEGRFNKNNDLLLLPVSKSTEVFAVNKTDWQTFENATSISIDSIKTQEDLVSVAKTYYEWTDSLTPDVLEDGKALYGRDAMANYIYIGSYQLGHELFNVNDGKLTVDLDRDTLKTLWDNYYIPYINGYFGSYANFRSEDAKTGKILALTSSSSGVSYLPTQVTSADDSMHDIELSISASLPFKNAKKQANVQQGAGYCLLKTSDGQQEGAVEFLKWFTDPKQNIDFALMSGYSPVTIEANNKKTISKSYSGDVTSTKGKNILNSVIVSAEIYANNNSYASRPFDGSKDIRTIFEKSMQDKAVSDRVNVVTSISNGATHEQAVAPYSSDEYFDTWFNDLKTKVNELIK